MRSTQQIERYDTHATGKRLESNTRNQYVRARFGLVRSCL